MHPNINEKMQGLRYSAGAKALLIVSIVFSMLVSGCAWLPFGLPQTGTSGGVVIEDFSPDLSEVYTGEPIKFTLKVRNTGSVESEKTFAELLGLDEDWYDDFEERFPNEAECRYDGSGFDLLPPSPDHGTQGESHICTWDYDAPSDIINGASVSYDATARVFYTYRTEVVKSVTLASREEMISMQQQGRTLPADTISSTSSPVSVTVDTTSPIRVFDDVATFPIEISIENVGGGVPCRENECKKTGEEKWNEIKLSIALPDGISMAGTGCNSFSGNGDYISVWPGKPNKITCDVSVDANDLTGPTQKAIRVSAEYSYFVDKTITVLVSSPG
jgi:hypothetical protein